MLLRRMVQPILFAALLAAATLGLSQAAQAYDWGALTPDSGGNVGSDASVALDLCEGDDTDGDTVPDVCDNCPDTSNPGQEDMNGNGIGDACDDIDGDGVIDTADNCPVAPNSDQLDTDEDGLGDACDSDDDDDTVVDCMDNCRVTANPDQSDSDEDDVGDACDYDDDNDGICDPGESDPSCTGSDLCPDTAPGHAVDANGCSAAQVDPDGDGICNASAPSGGPNNCSGSDNCPLHASSDLTNTDADLEAAGASVVGDPLGDVCDPDDDNDGFSDSVETYLGTDPRDNCADDADDDAWPLDMNNDKYLTVTYDVSVAYNNKIGCEVLQNPECERIDLDANGVITTADTDFFINMIGQTCD